MKTLEAKKGRRRKQRWKKGMHEGQDLQRGLRKLPYGNNAIHTHRHPIVQASIEMFPTVGRQVQDVDTRDEILVLMKEILEEYIHLTLS